MQTNEIIGYRVQLTSNETYVHNDANGMNYISIHRPEPISRPDALRRLAGLLDQYPDMCELDFYFEPVYREYTPLETASKELGGLLQSLCKRHGLELGMTQDQVEAKIAEELKEFGVKKCNELPTVDQNPETMHYIFNGKYRE